MLYLIKHIHNTKTSFTSFMILNSNYQTLFFHIVKSIILIIKPLIYLYQYCGVITISRRIWLINDAINCNWYSFLQYFFFTQHVFNFLFWIFYSHSHTFIPYLKDFWYVRILLQITHCFYEFHINDMHIFLIFHISPVASANANLLELFLYC